MLPQLGVPELLIILVIVVLIFGVGKLPDVGAALGKAIRDFRQATSEKPSEPKAGQTEEKER